MVETYFQINDHLLTENEYSSAVTLFSTQIISFVTLFFLIEFFTLPCDYLCFVELWGCL